MKELTIEEKAKRYDELIVTAQELEHDGCFDKITLFDLFPELEESEDERIKKAIKYGLDYVFTNNTTIYETTKEQCLAWLEKQGEKPTWSEEDIRKIKLICTYLDAYKAYQTPVGAEYIDGCISWAKALISRVGCEADCTTTWKPSIEQMDALYTYIYNPQYFSSPDPRMELVESVYKELKKLSEE